MQTTIRIRRRSSQARIVDLISYQHDGKGCTTIAGKVSGVSEYSN